MNIAEQENNLFDEWSKNREEFVFDGVASEVDYFRSKNKLCFVLKEVNDLNNGGWDLREFIRDGARVEDFDPTWNNVSRWVQCIQNGSEDIRWRNLELVTQELRAKTLRTVCAMNLKKSPGTHTTVQSTFEAAVAEDKEFIKRQYDLYNPDITICCGTGPYFRFALDILEEPIFETSRGIEWFLNSNNKPVIMFSHPAARIQASLLVYGLIDAVREIMSRGQI
jgi:hypothetical protein